MRFLAKLKGLFLNLAGLRREVDDYSRQTVEAAAKIWLRTALEEVPIWSGASRATFEQLGAAIGEPVPLTTAPLAPNRIALGRANSRGGVEKDGEGKWRFYYETSLAYLSANEQFAVEVGQYGVKWGLKKPTPYGFREKANLAVQGFAGDIPPPRIQIVEL